MVGCMTESTGISAIAHPSIGFCRYGWRLLS
jgi:hypothetical protein